MLMVVGCVMVMFTSVQSLIVFMVVGGTRDISIVVLNSRCCSLCGGGFVRSSARCGRSSRSDHCSWKCLVRVVVVVGEVVVFIRF